MKIRPINRIVKKIRSSIERFFPQHGSRIVYVPMVKGGMWVDHDTALCLSAVFAAVVYKAGSIANLPWRVRKNRDDGGSDLALTHRVDYLLHMRPNPENGAFDWRFWMLAMAFLWGNAYAEIERDTMGRPLALWPISPERVTPKRDENKRLYYEVMQQGGEKIAIDPYYMFHIHGLGSDGISGHSVVSLAARSIGAGLAADEFNAAFYENGTVLNGVLEVPDELGDEAYDRLKKDWEAAHKGPTKAWKTAILEGGTKWNSLTISQKDAEFIASRKFTVNDIARWFQVPPHKIADLERSTHNNIEQQNIEVIQDCWLSWIIRLEQEANYKLISQRNKAVFFTKINVNGVLRGDSAARSAYYKEMRNMGVMSVDEIRLLEDMNPIGPKKGGDKRVMQGQYTTLEKIGKEPLIKPASPNPNEGDEDNDEDNDNAKEAFRIVIHDAVQRVLKREQSRVANVLEGMKDKSRFEDWKPRFIQEHEAYARVILMPALAGYAQVCGTGFEGVIDRYIETYIQSLHDSLTIEGVSYPEGIEDTITEYLIGEIEKEE